MATTFRRASGRLRDPSGEATPKGLGVERGEDVAQMIVRRRAVFEGQKPLQKRQLGSAETGDVGEAVRAGDHRQQAKQQYLVERISDLAALPRVRHRFEVTKKRRRLEQNGKIGLLRFHPSLPRIRGFRQIQINS